MEKYVKFLLLFTGRHFWNRKCRKKTWWQQEFAVFKCEATANSVTGHVCVNSNKFFKRMAEGWNRGLSAGGGFLYTGGRCYNLEQKERGYEYDKGSHL